MKKLMVAVLFIFALSALTYQFALPGRVKRTHVGDFSSLGDPSEKNGVLIPYNEDDILVRKQLLSHAEPSDPIYFLTYEFTYCQATRDFVKLLGMKAAERAGNPAAKPVVAVVDGHYARVNDNGVEHEMLQWLANQGVQVRIYNPATDGTTGVRRILVDKSWINHRKVLVVGENLLMGGRNTGAQYLEYNEQPAEERSFVDIDVLVRKGISPGVVNDARTMIQDMASDNSSVPLPANSAFKFTKLLVPAADASAQATPLQPPALPNSVDIPQTAARFQVLKTASNWKLYKTGWNHANAVAPIPTGDEDEFRTAIHAAFKAESKEIYMETPYFYPDAETVGILKDALQRGVKLHLITNGLSTSDGLSKLIPVMMDKTFRELTAAGAKIQMTQNHMLHAKIFALRGQGLMFIGSHNMHLRSGFFDKEVMVSFQVDPAVLSAEDPASGIREPIDYRAQSWAEFSQIKSSTPPLLTPAFNGVVKDIIDVYNHPEAYDKDTQSFVQTFFGFWIKTVTASTPNIFSDATKLTVLQDSLLAEIATEKFVFALPVGYFL